MKYRKASDILPDALLHEIQKYTEGEAIYIPRSRPRRKWGERSGARRFFRQRNEEIRSKYFLHTSLEALADEYALSYETIRKIVFK
jgi:hypothetical protein